MIDMKIESDKLMVISGKAITVDELVSLGKLIGVVEK